MKSRLYGFGGFIVLIVALHCVETKKIKAKEDCEVCHEVLSRFAEKNEDKRSKELGDIEQAFMKFCKNLKGKEERFCYYIGGLETSATYILKELSKPFKSYVPVLKLCEKLYVKDNQICDLKYEKQIDLTAVNFKKLKVKDLKKILADWGEESACKGCTEKSDFVRVVKELMPKYNPAAAEQLKQKEKSEL